MYILLWPPYVIGGHYIWHNPTLAPQGADYFYGYKSLQCGGGLNISYSWI